MKHILSNSHTPTTGVFDSRLCGLTILNRLNQTINNVQ